jgi:hypothetical protein
MMVSSVHRCVIISHVGRCWYYVYLSHYFTSLNIHSLWCELVNPCFPQMVLFISVMAKILKWSSHLSAFMLLGEHLYWREQEEQEIQGIGSYCMPNQSHQPTQYGHLPIWVQLISNEITIFNCIFSCYCSLT